MEGVTSRVRRDQEGAVCVLRFVISAPDGSPVAVEMRGHEIRGVLDDGDRVVVPDFDSADADGIYRPTQVRNCTTASTVTAWRPPLVRRIIAPLGTVAWTTAVSSVVGLIVGTLLGGGTLPTAGGPDSSNESPFESVHPLVFILGVSTLVWVAWFGTVGVRRWRRGERIWPVALGVLFGVSLATHRKRAREPL
jgi:hypothetical protein